MTDEERVLLEAENIMLQEELRAKQEEFDMLIAQIKASREHHE